MSSTSRGLPRAFRGYFRGRGSEIALPTTRAVSEPLAEWALRRVPLDGKPFSFEGHEYLRAIYDDTMFLLASLIRATRATQNRPGSGAFFGPGRSTNDATDHRATYCATC